MDRVTQAVDEVTQVVEYWWTSVTGVVDSAVDSSDGVADCYDATFVEKSRHYCLRVFQYRVWQLFLAESGKFQEKVVNS